MKLRKFIFTLFVLIGTLACVPEDHKDHTVFDIHYYGAYGVHPGETISITPSYIGSVPSDFRIYSITLNGNLFYNPKLDGELDENSTFFVDPVSGDFKLQKTHKLVNGTYLVSLSCKSGGVSYEFPDAISVKVVKAE